MSLTTGRYCCSMIESAEPATPDTDESALREQLARGDALIGSVAPVLRHLLIQEDSGIFSEEIVARVRGMIGDLAAQLLDSIAVNDDGAERPVHSDEDISALTALIAADAALLGHVHALALEWQLTERLKTTLGLDPVLSPLLQALLESPASPTAALAMHGLAAQARFCQAQRRMQLPLPELPADLLHAALLALRAFASGKPGRARRVAAAEAAVRAGYDESRSRIALIARLVTGLGGGVVAALSVGHAGAAIFLTALAEGSGQERRLAVLATGQGQIVRLALALRAAGLKPEAIGAQLLALHPDAPLPPGFERVVSDRAAELIAESASCNAT